MSRKRLPSPPRPGEMELPGGDAVAALPAQPVLIVHDPRAIAFLSNPSNIDVVGGLIERECSIGEMADKFQVPLKNLAARVYRMVQLGLAQQTSEQPRNGRPIKRYRSLAQRFVLAPQDDSIDGLVDLQKARFYPFLDQLVQAQVAHMQGIARGRLVVQLTYEAADAITSAQWWAQRSDGTLQPLPDKPFHHAWGSFRLKPEDTDAFGRDMQAVVDRYMKRNCADGEAVMCVSSVVPQDRRGRRRRTEPNP